MFLQTYGILPEDVQDRIEFEQHNFFEAQPAHKRIHGWILRQCLHNWSDDDAAKITRAFIPAMEAASASTLSINKTVNPASGEVERTKEKRTMRADMATFVTTNVRLRGEEDWRSLIAAADPRLEVCLPREHPKQILSVLC